MKPEVARLVSPLLHHRRRPALAKQNNMLTDTSGSPPSRVRCATSAPLGHPAVPRLVPAQRALARASGSRLSRSAKELRLRTRELSLGQRAPIAQLAQSFKLIAHLREGAR